MNVRVLGLIVSYNAAQLPVAMRPLLISLVAAQQAGGFTAAGLAGGAAAAGMAVSAPWWSRALSRFGDRPVLLLSGALFLTTQLALATAHGLVPVVATAALCGLCTPPVSSSLRSMLPHLVTPETLAGAGTGGHRRAAADVGSGRAYAVNAVANETVYIASPLWVTGWAAFAGAPAALVASALAGAAALAAGLAFTPAVPRPPVQAGPSLVTLPAVRTLGGAYLAYWICMGAMWVLLPAFAAHAGDSHQAGPLVALWSIGSLAGGLALAVRGPRGARRDRYLWLLGTLAVTSLPLALPGTVPAMAVAITLFGVALAPWLATGDHLTAMAAGPRAAELYGWLTTVGQIGSAVGAALAGPLGDRYGGGPAFLLPAAALVAGLAIALTRRRTLPGNGRP
ncbi:MFS transporter [[Actinomadura] parvosata]|uniref:MFS transporter n=1 Tax=[Actinomadura] parvosata TaxID=1955412 RepID=UPI00406C7C8D